MNAVHCRELKGCSAQIIKFNTLVTVVTSSAELSGWDMKYATTALNSSQDPVGDNKYIITILLRQLLSWNSILYSLLYYCDFCASVLHLFHTFLLHYFLLRYQIIFVSVYLIYCQNTTIFCTHNNPALDVCVPSTINTEAILVWQPRDIFWKLSGN